MDDKTKNMVFLLMAAGIVVVFFALFYNTGFNTGSEIEKEEFVGIISNATDVHIVMELRGAPNSSRWGIMQCGVDFAASGGLAGKNVDYLSFDINESSKDPLKNDYCVHSEGIKTTEECFDIINGKGITIYIQNGERTRYYEKGMVVGINQEYEMGQCSIKTG